MTALPAGVEIGGFTITGAGSATGDGYAYGARNGEHEVRLQEFFPAHLSRRTAEGEAAPARPLDRAAFSAGLDAFERLTERLKAVDPEVRGFRARGSAWRAGPAATPLSTILRDGETVRGPAFQRLAHALADALAKAHGADLLHLDLSPDSVALDGEGQVVLLDHAIDRRPMMRAAGGHEGLARPGYSPIELFDASAQDPLGAFTDIHAASALLRRLVTGQAPDPQPRYVDGPWDWPLTDVPPVFIDAVEAGLRVHPEDRPQSVAAWRADWPAPPPADDRWRELLSRAGPLALPPLPEEPKPAPVVAPVLTTAVPAEPPKPAPAPAPAAAGARPAPAPDKPDPIVIVQPKPAPEIPAPRRRRVGPGWFAWLGLLLGAVVLYFTVVAPFLENATAETFYVTRPVKARPNANSDDPAVGTLPRGEAVRGHVVTGEDGETRFLKVTTGQWKDRYIWRRNLSERRRPELTGGARRQLRAYRDATIYAEPTTSADVAGTIDAGGRVDAAGLTRDGWYEVELQKGVGYIRREVFDPPPPDLFAPFRGRSEEPPVDDEEPNTPDRRTSSLEEEG